jgi:3-isopropylmalate/(R)-2-methylmalate dehydratase small subunit
MNPLVTLSGPAAPFLIDNVNTDMIAPMYRPAQAGVLRGLAVRGEDLAGMLFAGLRYDAQDREISDFVLNRPPFRNAHFLLGGATFGIRCVIAPSFGEIFRDNCFNAGMLPLVLPGEIVTAFAAEAQDGSAFFLDIAAGTLRSPSGRVVASEVPTFRREQLLTGADEIAVTLQRKPEIGAYQERERAAHPWVYLPQRQNC